MTAVVIKSATHGEWISISGTILEVLNVLVAENLRASNIVYYEDDKTNAKALACKFK